MKPSTVWFILTPTMANLPKGSRPDKSSWEPLVREMWAKGLTYKEMAKSLNTSATTVTRYAWQIGLGSVNNHKTRIRSQILKGHVQQQ